MWASFGFPPYNFFFVWLDSYNVNFFLVYFTPYTPVMLAFTTLGKNQNSSILQEILTY
jgi:hypothetical protein